LNANPVNPGYSGRRFFFTDSTAVIRMNGAAAATASDPAI
jgi:hypothetical protein